jgi:hypothetical protein
MQFQGIGQGKLLHKHPQIMINGLAINSSWKTLKTISLTIKIKNKIKKKLLPHYFHYPFVLYWIFLFFIFFPLSFLVCRLNSYVANMKLVNSICNLQSAYKLFILIIYARNLFIYIYIYIYTHIIRDGGRGAGRGHASPNFLKKKKF